jgi:hypothetical protein
MLQRNLLEPRASLGPNFDPVGEENLRPRARRDQKFPIRDHPMTEVHVGRRLDPGYQKEETVAYLKACRSLCRLLGSAGKSSSLLDKRLMSAAISFSKR